MYNRSNAGSPYIVVESTIIIIYVKHACHYGINYGKQVLKMMCIDFMKNRCTTLCTFYIFTLIKRCECNLPL